jgi:Flp pilus assembly protein TadG
MKNERGQSLVELAISLVFILYLLSGAAEFGILFFQYVQLRDAAQEGALFGSINPNNQALIIDRVTDSSESPLKLKELYDAGLLGITVKALDKDTNAEKTLANACESDGLEVKVSFTHKIFMPFIPKLIGRTEIPLTAVVTDTILTPVCP